jgi:uncharacterized protein (TIGR00730 family)
MARTRRRRYALASRDLNQQIEELVEAARSEWGIPHDAEWTRQTIVSALRLLHEGAADGDLKLVNSALKELRHAFRVFAPYRGVRKVAVFGSARTKPDHPDWKQAHAFAEHMVGQGWMVITGAGDGIMGAAQGGAGRESSFGVNIRLPFEQLANEVIAGDPKLINFRYFFTRKITFVKEAHAIALFPGGFGTHDEGFEALTLMQTGKSELLPVVFVDEPGGSYWRDWQRYVETHLQARGLISPEDLALFKVTDDVDAAVREVCGFYRNYHSSRYVGELLVIRVREAPDEEKLEALNEEFAPILADGRITVCEALPDEGGEVAGLPRLALHYDRRSVGRLRRLIDRLNAVGEPIVSTRDAAPHEIVPQALPEAARRAELAGEEAGDEEE